MPPIQDHFPLLDHRITNLEENQNELKMVLKEIAVAVQKLVLIDQRQVDTATIMDRLASNVDRGHNRIDLLQMEINNTVTKEREKREEEKKAILDSAKQLENRVDALEKADVENKRVRNWAFSIVTLMGVAIVGGIFKLIGLSL